MAWSTSSWIVSTPILNGPLSLGTWARGPPVVDTPWAPTTMMVFKADFLPFAQRTAAELLPLLVARLDTGGCTWWACMGHGAWAGGFVRGEHGMGHAWAWAGGFVRGEHGMGHGAWAGGFVRGEHGMGHAWGMGHGQEGGRAYLVCCLGVDGVRPLTHGVQVMADSLVG
jgi:hypothetical protein